MWSLQAISTVVGLLAVHTSLVAGQDLPPCINLSQYERGLCCMPGKACPYDGPPPPPITTDDTVPTYAVPEVWCIQGSYEYECLDTNCSGDGFRANCGPQGVCVCVASDGSSGAAPVPVPEEQPPAPVPEPEQQPTAPEPQPSNPEQKPEEKPDETIVPVPGRPGVVAILPGMPRCSGDQECEGDEICKGNTVGTCVENGDHEECACKEKEQPTIMTTKKEEPTTMVTVEKPSTTIEEEKPSTTSTDDDAGKKDKPPCIRSSDCPLEKGTCRRSSDCQSMTCAGNERKKCDEGRCVCEELFKGGTCKLHVMNLGDKWEHRADVKIYDGSGTEIARKSQIQNEKWGDTITVPMDDTKLPYDITLEFLSGATKKRKRDRPQVGIDDLIYQKYDIRFKAGEKEWSTKDRNKDKKPYCEVGGWDTNGRKGKSIIEKMGDFGSGQQGKDPPRSSQDMDCYWDC